MGCLEHFNVSCFLVRPEVEDRDSRGFFSGSTHPLRTLPYAAWRRARGPYAALSRSSPGPARNCIEQHGACPMQLPCSGRDPLGTADGQLWFMCNFGT
jgi:hypothetical protein